MFSIIQQYFSEFLDYFKTQTLPHLNLQSAATTGFETSIQFSFYVKVIGWAALYKDANNMYSQWESRKASTSPPASRAPISLAAIRPFLSRCLRTRTISRDWTYCSNGALR